jgi:Protein of unknown function DUF2617
MIVELDVPPIDTGAETLRLSFDQPSVLPALAILEVGGLRVEILGGSHRILLGAGITEELSCAAPQTLITASAGSARNAASTGSAASAGKAVTSQLPPAARNAALSFTSTVRSVTPAALAQVAQELRDEVGSSPYGIVATFPGHRDALTAVQVEVDAVSLAPTAWNTWHLYPTTTAQSADIVMTHTILMRTASSNAQVQPDQQQMLTGGVPS